MYATILDLKFHDKFGFTQDEVKLLLNDYDLMISHQKFNNGIMVINLMILQFIIPGL